MFRIIASFVFILIVIFACVGSLVLQSSMFEEIEDRLAEIEKAYDVEDYENCKKLSAELADYYEENTLILFLFSKHEGIENLLGSIKKLPYSIDINPPTFRADLEDCKSGLEVLKLQDLPNLVNIL